MSTAVAQCISCNYGMWLNGTICSVCPTGCVSCLSDSQCTYCDFGYYPIAAGAQLGTNAPMLGIMNCSKCASPCLACFGNANTCIACETDFTLTGPVCLSNFNYKVNVTLSVTLAEFRDNYITFLNQIANAVQVSINKIVILSIVQGSVVVNMAVSSPDAAGSSNAVTQQNNLQNLLNSGNVGGMGVASSTLTTIGGSNDSDDSGLSQTTIILLAVLIPVGVLLIVGIIVAIYCCSKSKSEDSQGQGMNEWNNSTNANANTGRSIEMSTNQTKRAYL